jgi:hypothetical protein
MEEGILEAVNDIRELVRLLAEPAIAERDRKLREELRKIVGSSKPKARAVLLMNGTRTQSAIHDETGINKGDLSSFVKNLRDAKLLKGEGKEPHLAISIPNSFFETGAGDGK